MHQTNNLPPWVVVKVSYSSGHRQIFFGEIVIDIIFFTLIQIIAMEGPLQHRH